MIHDWITSRLISSEPHLQSLSVGFESIPLRQAVFDAALVSKVAGVVKDLHAVQDHRGSVIGTFIVAHAFDSMLHKLQEVSLWRKKFQARKKMARGERSK